MIRRLLTPWRRDDGSAALETVILAPPMLAFIAMAVIGMRIEIAGGSIEGAAHDAARAASIARSSDDGYSAAITTAYRSLDRQGLRCSDLDVTVTFSGVATGDEPLDPDDPGVVRVVIGCTVAFSDVAVAGMRGSKRMEATFVSPIDIYRSRS